MGRRVVVGIATSLAIWSAAVFAAMPANADAPDDPCSLAVTFLCRFMPIAPDLDGDIDLTTQLPAAPNAEYAPPTDPCGLGCV